MTGAMTPGALRRRREEAGLSRRVVAERANIPLSRVWAAEREGGRGVEPETMAAITTVLSQEEEAKAAMAAEEAQAEEAPEEPTTGRHKRSPRDERREAVGIVITKLAEAAEAPQTVGRMREIMRAAVAELKEISDKALTII